MTAKITFGASCLVTAGIVGYVHVKQNIDREKLHEGVIRDIERQQRRKAENILILSKQADLTKDLRRRDQEDQARLKEKGGETE